MAARAVRKQKQGARNAHALLVGYLRKSSTAFNSP
jgi:hypothetical protein